MVMVMVDVVGCVSCPGEKVECQVAPARESKGYQSVVVVVPRPTNIFRTWYSSKQGFVVQSTRSAPPYLIP